MNIHSPFFFSTCLHGPWLFVELGHLVKVGCHKQQAAVTSNQELVSVKKEPVPFSVELRRNTCVLHTLLPFPAGKLQVRIIFEAQLLKRY